MFFSALDIFQWLKQLFNSIQTNGEYKKRHGKRGKTETDTNESLLVELQILIKSFSAGLSHFSDIIGSMKVISLASKRNTKSLCV